MLRLLFLSLMFVFCLFLRAFAVDSSSMDKELKWSFPYVHETGIFTGFARTKLDEKGNYDIIPAIGRFGYNLDSIGFGFCDLLSPVFDKVHVKPKGFTEFILEPFINTVINPNYNIEAGCAILLKYSYPLTEKIYPYAIGGGGGAYITQHTREEATQWGFTPQLGTGVLYFFKKDTALSVEYRYRHLSNANIKEPNTGINVDMFLVGISFFN